MIDLDDGLGSLAAHGGSESAVQLHHDQLLEERLDVGLIGQREVGIVGVLQIRKQEGNGPIEPASKRKAMANRPVILNFLGIIIKEKNNFPCRRRGSNPGPSGMKSDALTIMPRRHWHFSFSNFGIRLVTFVFCCFGL